MEQKVMNTTYTFEFCDGTTAGLTLAFYKLYQLKGKDAPLYAKYNKIMTKGPTDELEMITVLYTAYVCGNLDDFENIMSEEEFMMKCGSDRMAIKTALEELIQPKKQ